METGKNDARIELRCTKEEKKKIKQLSNKLNISITELLLNSALYKRPVISRQEVLNVLKKLSTNDLKVENNINQIAKKINENKLTNDPEFLLFFNENFNKMIEKRDNFYKEMNSLYRLLSKDDN